MIRAIANSVFFFVLSMGAFVPNQGRNSGEVRPVTVNLINAEGRSVAGSHFDPADVAHGGHDGGSLPAGDIPNFLLTVKDDGTAHTTMVAPNVTMSSDMFSVFSNGGTAIVIHATSDKVTAAAPPRIACGIISKPE